ncbi:MAG: GGDEF domain-containing protein [Microthrixaceae bacterium]
MLRHVRKRGVTGFVVEVSIAIVAAAVVLVLAAMTAMFGIGEPKIPPVLGIASVVAAIIAPSVLMFIVRLAAGLDKAADLLWRVSRTDSLTGVANRRSFFDALCEMVSRPATTADLAIVDIDAFKDLNDRFGHQAGDAALRQVSQWLRGLVAESGTVARIGGDEFAVLVPGDAHDRPIERTFDLDGIRFSVTLGWQRVRSGEDPDAVVRAADFALYANKPRRRRVTSMLTTLDHPAPAGEVA